MTYHQLISTSQRISYLSPISRRHVLQGERAAAHMVYNRSPTPPCQSRPSLARKPVNALVELVIPSRGCRVEGADELRESSGGKWAERGTTSCDGGEACLDPGVDEADVVTRV